MKKLSIATLLAILVALSLVAACATLPENVGRKETFAYPDTGDTLLGREVSREGSRASGRVRIPPAAQRPGRVRRPRRPGARRRAEHRRAVLPLPRRSRRPVIDLAAPSGGGPGSPGSPAGRRHGSCREGFRRGRPGQPPQRGSPHLQSLQPQDGQNVAIRDPHGIGDPPDAQQVVHGRRPGDHPGRPQHRQRIFRGGSGPRVRGPGRPRRRAGRPGRFDRLRPVLEQRTGLPRIGPDRQAPDAGRDRAEYGNS